jgi:hypothetical protein
MVGMHEVYFLETRIVTKADPMNNTPLSSIGQASQYKRAALF